MEEIEKELEKIYYNKSLGFTGFQKFYERVKEQKIKITRKDLKEWYDKQQVTQTFKKVKQTNTLKITAHPYSYQIDVVFIKKLKFLFLIEITSRKLFAYNIVHNTLNEILDKLNEFIKNYKIIRLEGDLQFQKESILKFCNENNIQYDFQSSKDDHITKTGNRLGIIDRVVRTIKMMVNKSKANSKDAILDLVNNYNSSIHSVTNQKPNDLYENIFKMIDIHNFINSQNEQENKRFSVGDFVRIKLNKIQFQKEGQEFSKEIYEVEEIVGNKYKIKSLKKLYKENELIKSNQNQTHVNQNLNERVKPLKNKKVESHIDIQNVIHQKRTIKKPKVLDL